MNKINLTQEYSVSGPLSLQDIQTLQQEGVKSLICTRPDGEEPEQLSFATIQASAENYGMQVFHIPVKPGQYSEDDVASFWSALSAMQGQKVHGYCRTGTRAAHLWLLSLLKQGQQEKTVLLEKLKASGIKTDPLAKYI